MRFRSCKNSRVCEVILGYDDDQAAFVRFSRTLPNGVTETVINVTQSALAAGAKTDFEWTEVMLLGNSEDQDTAEKPFASSQPVEKSYVANALYRRFYRLPVGVKLRLDSVFHRFDTPRNFSPIGARYDKFKRTETVGIPERDLKIHFLHDPSVEDRSGLRMSSRGSAG